MKRLTLILTACTGLLLSACASDGYYGGDYYGRDGYSSGSFYGGTYPTYRDNRYRDYYGNRPRYDHRYYDRR